MFDFFTSFFPTPTMSLVLIEFYCSVLLMLNKFVLYQGLGGTTMGSD